MIYRLRYNLDRQRSQCYPIREYVRTEGNLSTLSMNKVADKEA